MALESWDKPRLWSAWRPINYPKSLEVAAGIGAALLAGFSLTTVTQIADQRRGAPTLDQPAMAAFAIAALLLIYSLQFTAAMLGMNATPSQRLELHPEARTDRELLELIRLRQWQEMELRAAYGRRAEMCYNVGIIAFFSGLGLVLVPRQLWPWSIGTWIAITASVCAVVIEIAWALSGGRAPRFIHPDFDPTRLALPPPLPDPNAVLADRYEQAPTARAVPLADAHDVVVPARRPPPDERGAGPTRPS